MARTLDEIVRDTLGNLQLQIIQLQARLEAIEEKKPDAAPPETPA